MKKTIFLSLSLITASSFASTVEKIESTKARIDCVFSAKSAKNGVSPKKLSIVADLSKKTARVLQFWDDENANDENKDFSILTLSRASNAKDRETLKMFSILETSKDYTAPSTLVIAANNGDDTDQTLIIQYRPGFESEKNLKSRGPKDSDFRDVNLQYMQSCDGKLSGAQSVSCTMVLE